MNIINKIVDWCLETKKVEQKDERVYISCKNLFLHPSKPQSSYAETEKLLEELFN
ncbi:MAG: hypothetical protein IKV61_00840 [Clostridia bacterium]|nr:hypothetical protein [Clostridia bacterium]